MYRTGYVHLISISNLSVYNIITIVLQCLKFTINITIRNLCTVIIVAYLFVYFQYRLHSEKP